MLRVPNQIDMQRLNIRGIKKCGLRSMKYAPEIPVSSG